LDKLADTSPELRTAKTWDHAIVHTTDNFDTPGLIRWQWRKFDKHTHDLKQPMIDRKSKTSHLLPESLLLLQKNLFTNLWGTQDHGEETITSVLEEPGVESVSVILEGVKSAITTSLNQRNGTFLHEKVVDNFMFELFFKSKGKIRYCFTKNAKETAEHIVRTTRALTEGKWKDPPTLLSLCKPTNLMSDNAGSVGKPKNRSLKDTWICMLIQLPGVTEKSARAIVDDYPTIYSLFKAYQNLSTESERETLLANIRWKARNALSKRKVGPAISKKVYKAIFGFKTGKEKVQ